MFELQSLKISAWYLYSFSRKALDKETEKSTISRTGSDVTTRDFKLIYSRSMPTIPENFMKIRPRVFELSSKKKKKNNNNNREKETEE